MFNSVFRAVPFNYTMEKKKSMFCIKRMHCQVKKMKNERKGKKTRKKKQVLLNQEQDENAQGNRRQKKTH